MSHKFRKLLAGAAIPGHIVDVKTPRVALDKLSFSRANSKMLAYDIQTVSNLDYTVTTPTSEDIRREILRLSQPMIKEIRVWDMGAFKAYTDKAGATDKTIIYTDTRLGDVTVIEDEDLIPGYGRTEMTDGSSNTFWIGGVGKYAAS